MTLLRGLIPNVTITHLKSGGDLKKAILGLGAGDTLELEAAGTYKPAYVVGKNDFTLIGNGATIRGGINALKFEGCRRFRVEGLSVKGAQKNGLMIVGCDHVCCADVDASDNAVNGILTGNSSGIALHACQANRNRGGHGIYFSQGGDTLTVHSSEASGNGRCGIQVNAIEEHPKRSDPTRDNRSKNVHIQGCLFEANQQQGGATINLAGVHTAAICGCKILGMLGRHGIAAWDDGTGDPRDSCTDVHIDGCEFSWDPKAHPQAWVSVGKGCGRITVGKNTGPANVPMRVDG